MAFSSGDVLTAANLNDLNITSITTTGASTFKADQDITDFTDDTRGIVTLYNSDGAVDDFTCLDFDGNSTDPAARIGMKYTSGGSELHFGTSNSYSSGITNTALVIGPTGNVIVGLEGAAYPGTDPALGGQSTSIALGGYRNSSTTTHDVFVLKSDVGSTGAVIFYVEADGDVFSKTGSYGAIPSDSRLKTTEPCRDYYEDLRKLEVINYQVTKDLKDNGDGTVTLEDLETPSKKMLGLVAQETEKHIPGLVTTDEHGYKGIRTTVLIPMLLQMCQKLADKVEALEG